MSVSDRIVVMRAGRIEQVGAPIEVYQRPRTRFVAEFLGAANLIPAQRVDGTLRTPLGNLEARAQPEWNAGTLVIRPEHVRIVVAAPPTNGARAIVKEVIYRGSHQEVLVEASPAPLSDTSHIPHPTSHIPLRLHAPAAPPLTVGEQLWLELPRPSVEILVD